MEDKKTVEETEDSIFPSCGSWLQAPATPSRRVGEAAKVGRKWPRETAGLGKEGSQIPIQDLREGRATVEYTVSPPCMESREGREDYLHYTL